MTAEFWDYSSDFAGVIEAVLAQMDIFQTIATTLDAHALNIERLEAMIIALQDGTKYTGDR